MATTVAFDDGFELSGSGSGPGAGGPEQQRAVGVPVGPRRQRNTLWMLAGVLLVGVSGLAALSIFSSLSTRVDVLVAARPLTKGQVVVDGDFEVVSIAADSGVRAMAPERRAELVGMIATGPIGPGSIVHPAQFTAGDAADEDKVIVGAALEAGQYPRSALRPGDEVILVEVTGASAGFEQTGAGPREIGPGEVVEATQLTRSDTLLVSIRVNESMSVLISERAAQDRLRLVLVDHGFPSELVEPVEPLAPVEPQQPEAPGS